MLLIEAAAIILILAIGLLLLVLRAVTLLGTRSRKHSAFYAAYLRSPQWYARRRQKLRTVGYRCQRLGLHGGALEVHHRHYDNLGHEALEDLDVLCHRHHEIEHGRRF